MQAVTSYHRGINILETIYDNICKHIITTFEAGPQLWEMEECLGHIAASHK